MSPESGEPVESAGSVTAWIGELKADDVGAKKKLWDRYFERLARCARGALRTNLGVVDEEDVALSALDTFFSGAAKGRFPALSDREGLWRLLAFITARKAADQLRREGRLRRGGGRILDEAALAGPEHAGGEGLGRVADPGPPPELAAILAEEVGRRIDALPDTMTRRVARLKMEGYTTEEVAKHLGRVPRTVERKMEIIRRHWVADMIGHLGGTVARDAGNPTDWVVMLRGSRIGDDDLSYVAELTGLRTLDLAGTRVSDAGLEYLRDLRGLRVLDLTGTRVTEAGLAGMREAVPEVEIRR